MGRDLSPEIYVTSQFFLSFFENRTISPRPRPQEEKFEVFPFKFVKNEMAFKANVTDEFIKSIRTHPPWVLIASSVPISFLFAASDS